MGELILRLREQFSEMYAQYDKLAGRIKPTESTDVIDNPVKREWAAQEGYRPGYNPNSNTVTWTKTPEPAYQQARTKNMQGSMSPERLVESFPAFSYKAANLDGHIQEVITQAMNGQITSQRAKEMMYQFALETFDEAWSEGKPEGAAKTAASFDEAMGNASKSNKVAG